MNVPGICLVAAGSLIFAATVMGTRPVEAVAGCIPGSYLAREASGTQSLWTFSSDGTFQATSSAERALNFSHIQGTWQRDAAHSARAVGLDFGFLPQPVGAGVPPQWVTRIDVSLTFARDCRQFAGGFELRFYDAAGDPLDPTTMAPAGADTLIGRRIQVP